MIRPAKTAQMTTPMRLQTPTIERINGVAVKSYTDANGVVMANFASYGGTEKTVNGIIAIEDTATVTTWYRPDLQSDCRLIRLTDGAVFDVIGEPENIEMRNMFSVCKVRRVKGGA